MVDGFASVFVVAQVERFAAAQNRGTVEQVAVGRGPDAQSENAGGAATRLDRMEHFVLVDKAVGQENGDPQVAGGGRLLQCFDDPFRHLGAAASTHVVDEGQRSRQMLATVGERTLEEGRRVAREANDVEAVTSAHASQDAPHRLLALLHGEAAHRPGGVGDDDDLAGRDLRGRHVALRLHDQGKETAPIIEVRDESHLRRNARHLIAKNEVFVGHRVCGGQLDARLARCFLPDAQGM